MTATSTPPRRDLLAALVAADLEVNRLRGHLRRLDRSLGRIRRHLSRGGAGPPWGPADLLRTEAEYEEVEGRLRAARLGVQALLRDLCGVARPRSHRD